MLAPPPTRNPGSASGKESITRMAEVRSSILAVSNILLLEFFKGDSVFLTQNSGR